MEGLLPSEEKIWCRYYGDEELNAEFSHASMYQAIHHDEYEERTAFTYFGRSFSYRKLYEGIERTAQAFVQNGIGKGDVVMLMLPTLPESLYCFYALNRIGAVSNLVDVRTAPGQLVEIARKTKPRMILLMDFYLERVDSIKDLTGIDKIIVLRGCDSFPSAVFMYRISELFNGRRRIVKRDSRYAFWPEFIKSGKGCSKSLDADVKSDDIAAIYQTSGTTGFPKSALHTNFNLNNSSMMKHFHMNEPKPGDKVLSILPLFALFGFVFDIHMPLRYGMTLVIVPLFKDKNMADLILRHKPNHIFSVPSQWESVAGNRRMECSLSFIKTIYVAGEVLDKSLKVRINSLLRKGGSKAELCADYGMTETGGTISFVDPVASSDDECDSGYSGIPMPLCNICIYDNEAEKEVDYDRPGEITVQVPFAVKGYCNDRDATGHLFRRHPDGSVWLHTGDIGYLTEKGHLYVIGRKKRMIVRFDGSKLFPVELESVIKEVRGVIDCYVVPAPDPDHAQGKVPYAFVVTEKPDVQARVEKDIIRMCRSKLPVYLQPYGIKFIEDMPRNSMGKTDYLKLVGMI
ncbi:MAG: acyl--CoA ligase [Bacteroidaceae bacterium]|nr:acyl--CoA ligase [Bacteroidaceae bacterium]